MTERSARKALVIDAIRRAAATVPMTGDAQTDAAALKDAVFRETGARPLPPFPPPPVVQLPFEPSPALKWALPFILSKRRQSERGFTRLMGQMAAPRATTRTLAAFQLGGWGPSHEVDRLLLECLAHDSSPYARSQAALGLAVRDVAGDEVIAYALSRRALETAPKPFPSYEPVVMALFAAVVVAARRGGDTARQVRASLEASEIPGEEERLAELNGFLSRN